MKNVTISLDDETHRLARIRAAELGTSLSALVKDYLNELVRDDQPQEVRDMQTKYSAPPQADAEGPPWLVNGQWVYTKDGKPRQPGAMRGMIKMADDWDEWPEGFLESLERWDYDNPTPSK